MTSATRNRAVAHSFYRLNPISLLQSASRRFADWRQCRIAVRELQNLDHRMLRDIGLDRSEILAAAYGTLERPARRGRNPNTNNRTINAR